MKEYWFPITSYAEDQIDTCCNQLVSMMVELEFRWDGHKGHIRVAQHYIELLQS